ncbi:MAG: 30S ribosomal protein S12 methylthiotransferase RimO [Desulfobacteraceae bacterium]|nr:MAG: 30S ribosomal protein S12 methylthiotransferase RimO [Desulfobacteraceae bacterium]
MLIYLESLGCARNQVDSETMLARLEAAGIGITDDPSLAEAIVVNTCSFIESAADESIDTILELAKYKREGRCRRLIVTGCLPERYRDPIVEALPEVDFFLGTGAYEQIVPAVQGAWAAGACLLPDPDAVDSRLPVLRKPLAAHSAYLKIAEGCSRHCTYCIIPKLRGGQKSRPLATLLQEARALIADGARELTLVAQETTAYGQDLRPPTDLARLLSALAGVDPSVWIRVMYGHPQSITAKVIQTLAAHANLCAYLDIPVQHASSNMLRRMGRGYTDRELLHLFTSIRAQLPDAALRTTVLVGFPGESQDDFKQLLDFIEQARFDHLGVFAYSDAEDLPSHHLGEHVDAVLAQERLDMVMALQQRISAEKLTRFQGRTLQVLVDAAPKKGDDFWIGRTCFQAPEVDGVTLIKASPEGPAPVPGNFIPVRVVQTLDYDLITEAL